MKLNFFLSHALLSLFLMGIHTNSCMDLSSIVKQNGPRETSPNRALGNLQTNQPQLNRELENLQTQPPQVRYKLVKTSTLKTFTNTLCKSGRPYFFKNNNK